MPAKELTLFSRRGCHLCELMIEELIPLCRDQARLTVIDVDTQPDWRERYGPSAPAKTTEQLEAELRTLRRENDSLRTQRDILKKTLGILVEPPPNATRA